MTYTAKLIKGGKIVIPADLRHELGFADGDRLVFERDGETLVIKSYRPDERRHHVEYQLLRSDDAVS